MKIFLLFTIAYITGYFAAIVYERKPKSLLYLLILVTVGTGIHKAFYDFIQ